MNTQFPIIPQTITVHLGPPDSEAQNVTVDFISYIANVASNEIYPTWPANAITANVLAQISFALNRIYTEYYRTRGYNFDITNSTSIDQSFSQNGTTFENVELIVNQVFDSYIRRKNNIVPLFAQYCDGKQTQCPGLSQWGTVELANMGYTPIDILKYYYGDDIELIEDVPMGEFVESFPQNPLYVGSTGEDVKTLQLRLNRISKNYPSIPKIANTDGIFGNDTENAVIEFQKIFALEQDGVVGRATWYKIQGVYNAVKRLNELISEAVNLQDISLQFPGILEFGDMGVYVSILQYFINFIATFDDRIWQITIDGYFDEETREALTNFQRLYSLEPTGISDEETWNRLYDFYAGILGTIPPSENGVEQTIPYPGFSLQLGSTGDYVRLFQQYINVISDVYPQIPKVTEDGIFGTQTRDAVYALQNTFGLSIDGIVGAETWNTAADIYNDIIAGDYLNEGQYPGYEIGGQS